MSGDIRARLDAMQARAEAATYVGGDMQVLADDALDLLAFARDVLDLHRPERLTGNLVADAKPPFCGGCYEAGGCYDAPLWEDCPVVALATRHLGGGSDD